MNLFFDTETTGKHLKWDQPYSNVDNFARLVQLGYVVTNGREILVEQEWIVKPEGFEIPSEASNVHKITTEHALIVGVPVKNVLDDFAFWVENCDVLIGHNISFDLGTVGAEYWRIYQKNLFEGKDVVCTMKGSTDFCKLPGGRPFKYPKLHELYTKLFSREMGAAHTALQDIKNTVDCYFALIERGVLK